MVMIGKWSDNVRVVCSYYKPCTVEDLLTASADLTSKFTIPGAYTRCAYCMGPAKNFNGYQVLDPTRTNVPGIVSLGVVPCCDKAACTSYAQKRRVSALTRIAGGVPKDVVCAQCFSQAQRMGRCQGCKVSWVCTWVK